MKKLIKDIYDTSNLLDKSNVDYENMVNRIRILNQRLSEINKCKGELTCTPAMIQESNQIKHELSMSHSNMTIIKKEGKKLKTELEFYEKNLLSFIKSTPPTKVDSIEVLMIMQSLIKHKEKYRDFSRDLTRVSSMRVISAQIADDLDDVINLCANSAA